METSGDRKEFLLYEDCVNLRYVKGGNSGFAPVSNRYGSKPPK